MRVLAFTKCQVMDVPGLPRAPNRRPDVVSFLPQGELTSSSRLTAST
jgi:hypothetical protein